MPRRIRTTFARLISQLSWQPATPLGALLCCLCSRLPAFRWSAISDDEAIYDSLGLAIAAGGSMYVDALDHKPPGLATTYGLIASLFPAGGAAVRMHAVHALGIALALGTAWGLLVLGRRLLPARSRAWPALLFALSSTAKIPFDGLAVNGELLLGLPSIWCLVAADSAGRLGGRLAWLLDILAGMLLGAATLCKWQAFVLLPALLVLGPPATKPWRTVMSRLAMWGVGITAALVPVALYFYARDAHAAALKFGLLFNRLYLAAGTTGVFWWKRLGLSLLGAVLPSALLYGAGLWSLGLVIRHRADNPLARAVAAWAALSLSAVALGGRFFGHYYLQAELPLTLLAAAPLEALWRRHPRWLALPLGLPPLAFFLFSLGPARVLSTLNSGEPNWPVVAAELRSLARPGDSLFVWGNAPMLQHHAELPLATRFVFSNYLTGLSPATPSEQSGTAANAHAGFGKHAWSLLADDFARHPPTLVVDTAAAGWKGYGPHAVAGYSLLSAWLKRDYHQIGLLDGSAPVYRRNHSH